MKRHLLALLLGITPVAHAAPETYPAESFVATRPANAAQMLARVPGFTLVDADDDVRGYGGAQGNVLIDGARPASKRESLETLLERIPATAVERVELIRVGTPGYEFFGHPVLANIVRREAARTTAAFEAGVLVDARGGVEPSAAVEWSRQWDGRALDLAFASVPELDDDSGRGSEIETSATTGETSRSIRDTRRVARLDRASADWRQPLAGGKLQAFAALRDEDDRASTRITGDDPAAQHERERLREAEFGLRYARAVDDATTLEALASDRRARLGKRELEYDDDGGERFAQHTRSRESIARLDLRRTRSPRLTWNASAEIAFNTLAGSADLEEDGESVALPGARVEIEEARAEVTAGATFRAGERWRFDAALGLEHSRLQQRGDSPADRDFTYLKPAASARWERSAHEAWSLSLGRRVGQLDFEDFVASAALDTGVVTVGNAGLEPDKTWRLALAWEHSFGRDGAFALTLAHERIDDVVDLVPVVDGDDVFDAPGNLARGARDSLAFDAGSSLAAFGWPEARIEAELRWQRSRVSDPLTGARRGISGEAPLEGRIAFTHVPGAWQWGIALELAQRETDFRVDEVSIEREATSWQAFAQRELGPRWRLRAELTDAGGRVLRERRERHAGPRASGPLQRIETREHRVPGQLLLTLRRDMAD